MKKTIRKLLHGFGFDLHRFSPSASPSAQLIAVLNLLKIDTVFDVGANKGQFAQELRLSGFSGMIVSFDPLTSAHSQLTNAAESDSNWLVHSRVALGDHDGEILMNIAANSVSSSALPMLDAHLSAAVDSEYVSKESTPLIRLDSVFNQYLHDDTSLFVKIDTQGFEWQVIDGGLQTLQLARGALIELSLIPLYAGQKLWLEIINRMANLGFSLWAIQRGFADSATGRTLQVDAIFVRN